MFVSWICRGGCAFEGIWGIWKVSLVVVLLRIFWGVEVFVELEFDKVSGGVCVFFEWSIIIGGVFWLDVLDWEVFGGDFLIDNEWWMKLFICEEVLSIFFWIIFVSKIFFLSLVGFLSIAAIFWFNFLRIDFFLVSCFSMLFRDIKLSLFGIFLVIICGVFFRVCVRWVR